ncbi:MAG: hypothetical protein ACRDV7_07150, partial [Acidimicrobiia bacterium]
MPHTNDIPAPPRHEVRRRQLTARLTASLAARLALVTGPAGSGKTAAVAQWARALGQPVIWLALDDTDDDLDRFRSRLLDAIPGAAASRDLPLSECLASVHHEMVLVCDGVDAIEDPQTIAMVDELCADAPVTMHIVLIGRAVPALARLTRLRLNGDLQEITADELRCNDAEAESLLDALEYKHEPEDRAELLGRTEGLIAAVALAGVLARDHEGRSIDTFNGATAEFAQYLYSEVLD